MSDLATDAGPSEARAIDHWGEPLPDWLAALARACDETSQGRVAARLGYSKAAINRVLKRSYPVEKGGLEAVIRQVLMQGQVSCPVLGTIEGDACLKIQRQPFQPGNHLAVRLFRACRDCPNAIHQRRGES